MIVTIESYWKVQAGSPAKDHPMKELCQFKKVGLGDPRGIILPGQDPDDRFMHLSTSTGIRVLPPNLPTPLNPLALPVVPGAVQIQKTEYDALILAMRQTNPSYDSSDYA